jgi:photosystem II stability/assembly factor-like uncharacterized protein
MKIILSVLLSSLVVCISCNKEIRKFKKITSFIIISLCIISCNEHHSTFEPIDAASIKWEQTNGPYGGPIKSMFLFNGRLFLGTNNGLYSSSDNGSSWELNNLAFSVSMSFSSSSNGNIYAVSSHSIFISSDYGEHWKEAWVRSTSSLTSLAVSPNGDIFIGDAIYGIYHSTNNGLSWREENLQGVNVLGINKKGDIFAGTSRKGMYYSTDNGSSWQQVDAKSTGTNIQMIYIDDINNYLFASSSDYPLIYSIDNGFTWETGNKGLYHPVTSIKSTGNNHFYCISMNSLYESNDRCKNWINIPFDNIAIKDFAINDNNIFLATYWKGFYRSSQSTYNWQQSCEGLSNETINRMDINTNGTIIAVTEQSGNFLSHDEGDTWKPFNEKLRYNVIREIMHSKNDFYALFYDENIYFSPDNGETWIKTGKGPLGTSISEMKINSNGDLYTIDEGVLYRSSDKGNSWKKNHDFGCFVYDLIISDNNFLVQYTLSENSGNSSESGIFYSKNGGSWIKLKSSGIMKALFDRNGNIITCNENNIYRLKHSHNTPDFISIYNCPSYIEKFSANEAGDFFIVSDNSIYYSSDSGENWIILNSNLPKVPIGSICANSIGRIFIGTKGRSIYRNKN